MLAMEFANALADFGAHVVLLDRREEPCRDRAEALRRRSGRDALGLACNVIERPDWERVVGTVLARWDRIDVLVNGAAYTTASQSARYDAGFEEFPLADWKAILDVNLTGTFLGCQTVGRQMLTQGSGSIINVASLYGIVSPHHRMYQGTGVHQPAAYSVSKAGVLALTRYLGTLWADRGVRVNALTPGGVWDGHRDPFLGRYAELSPSGRMLDRREVRGAVAFLASDASSSCIGQNLVVDGGWTVW
jgi:NAD(P)-dependent dehydrogenase (short-subunit alcohol dehydrogenase family)